MKLGDKALQWLSEQNDAPPKGWRSVAWIRENKKKNCSHHTCKVNLDRLVAEKQIPPPKRFKAGQHWSTYYFIGE